MKFTHLHLHSHYSLLDGLPKIDEIIEYVKELGMDSVALTDHGNLYGAVEFYKKAKQAGIKPIIGCEMYQAYERMEQKRPHIDDKRYHLVLLVKNKEGYKNLVKLVTEAHLRGFYYKPRIDEEILAQHSSGLIGLSACLQGKIPQLIIANKIEEAKKTALRFKEIFGEGNFYLELQHHPNIPEQKKVNQALIRFSKELNIPLVATCDSHYLRPEDAQAQDILMLINTGADPNDPERLTMKSDVFSVRSPQEMMEFFKDIPEAIENTQRIVEECNFEFELGKTKLPRFEVPEGKTPNSYLRELCQEGLKKRYGTSPRKEVIERMEYELSVIEQTGFASYFLIVQDFVNWAKQRRIVVGPGRGSAAGSLVAYLLGITNVDPLKYNLLFERFLNKERISMPDIDIDFTDRRRDEVIEYIAQKYGRNRVAQIITFGTMAARAVVRDVGRALGYSYSFCDRIAKMIPFGFTLDQALEKISEFRELYENDDKVRKLIDFAKKLEGCARHASTHACGVVVSNEPLDTIVPLQHPTQDEKTIVTQYEMHSIEDLGLLKIDLLGLKNLTIIEDTLARIYKVQNKKIDIENIPHDDKKTFELLQKGETTGVFQLESDGMKKYLKQLKPTKFDDIIAMVALYRPGPMGLIPEYIQRKHGIKKIEYPHPKCEKILASTYGIPVYQEQIMQIAQELAGFSLSEADILRKAIGKKIKKLLLAQKEKFINGMIRNN
ncbi:MAG TPA: DNA polymerase III subunit alpha, partial [bacterium]|nr:DNA polymerase III subunit alpha [bacterium]